ncbi:hypothetical protein F751_1114 [Auxenochlorella protothecoides]|uniref:Uncharacterized protein n=1 Tax=Auxenochlorella protothecoides TaxID=3075 RepID=A0A087SCG4_AUXPR|nr:hypothetical protein F751_1114 [Auxenochlorella protothecoides]KFM23418.1 hypothetical protein F751_1114 [Auxenochlorella protothecoides]
MFCGILGGPLEQELQSPGNELARHTGGCGAGRLASRIPDAQLQDLHGTGACGMWLEIICAGGVAS